MVYVGFSGCGGSKHVVINGTRYDVECDPMTQGQKLALGLGLGLGLGIPFVVIPLACLLACLCHRWLVVWRRRRTWRKLQRRYDRLPGDISILAMLLDSHLLTPEVSRRLGELDPSVLDALAPLPMAPEAKAAAAVALLRAHASLKGEDVVECHARWAPEMGDGPVMALALEMLVP